MTNWRQPNLLLLSDAEPELPFWQLSGIARSGPQDRFTAPYGARGSDGSPSRTERSEGGRATRRAPRRYSQGQ
jgi:hypothetical protein